jgi:hypothetical protein
VAVCSDGDVTGRLLCTFEILQDAQLWNLVADMTLGRTFANMVI